MWGPSAKVESFAFILVDSIGIRSKELSVVHDILIEKSAVIVLTFVVVVLKKWRILYWLISCKRYLLYFLWTTLWVLKFYELSFDCSDVLIQWGFCDGFFRGWIDKIKLLYLLRLNLFLGTRCLRLFIWPVPFGHILGLRGCWEVIELFRIKFLDFGACLLLWTCNLHGDLVDL